MSVRVRAQARRVAALLLLTLSVLAGSAAAGDAREADKHFRRGVERYKDNDFSAALVEFQRAYETKPSYQVLYNIGETQYQLQDWASAQKTLKRYLDDGGKRISWKRRKDVERELAKLTQRVATVKIVTSEPGAAVTIDDVAIGPTPLADPILVNSGKRKITATLPGRAPVTEIVDLAGGDVKDISLTIPPLLAPKVVTKPSIAVPLAAWAATGAVVTGAIVTGVLALGASGDVKEQLRAYPADPQAIQSAHKKALAFSVVTDVLTATALAASGVSIWLTVKNRREAGATTTPTATPTARLVVYPNGIGVAGTF
jgi:hypothetical protein